jgi:enoyl-CoA hydratase
MPEVMTMTHETILTETKGAVGIITLNRPKALNALNAQLIDEMNLALDAFDADNAIRCIILTGSEKAFAAGADIREMKDFSKAEALQKDFLKSWDHFGLIKKPIIAAVSGFCLGGGFEFALASDFIIASDTAKFAFPEITLGIFPGGGGTQRLTRLVGKAKAMDMILTGRMMDAVEAERLGIVARIVPAEQLMQDALVTAEKIASYSNPAVIAAKRAVLEAEETSLASGLRQERAAFYARFDSADQKEGMAAFLEKRKAHFTHS